MERKQDVTIKYKFGIFNRVTEEAEMGAPDRYRGLTTNGGGGG